MAKKLAIVLSGGGAKGAFQVGVLDALITTHGVKPAIAVGTSTGAIQALGVAQDDIAGLLKVWTGIKGNSDIYTDRSGLLGTVIFGGKVTKGATYVAMEGPQFSSRAESLLYRQWGADVIGMTAMPEAKLAREAELPYALIGMVTDYDCWRESEAHVDVAEVIAQMHKNGDTARRTVSALIASLPAKRTASPIDTVLDFALMTDPAVRDPALLAKLDAILARVNRG